MHTVAKIAKAVEKNGDTWLVVQLPGVRIKEEIDRKMYHVYGIEFTEEKDDKQQQEREEVRVGTGEDLPGAWL